jgi:hypothetical protein
MAKQIKDKRFMRLIARMRKEGLSLVKIAGNFALRLKQRADAEVQRG